MKNARSTSGRHLWHPYTPHSAAARQEFPCIVGGKGIHLFDDQGRCWADAIASWWCCALGHGHPRIVRAIRDQAARHQHSILGGLSHPWAAELATRLARLMPSPDRHVLFSSDGASAVEAALKIALQYAVNRGEKRRRRLATLEHAYHGDTLAAVAVGYIAAFHRPFRGLLAPVFRIAPPLAPDHSDYKRRVHEARALFARHGGELAALIVEPLVQGSAGMRMYPPEFLGELAELCRAHGVVLIVDEIATGFGRTGRMFAFEHAGIDPDIVCVGKALSAGSLPISAAIVKDRLYETFADLPRDRSFHHGHTFTGNPIAAAAALEALAVYRKIGAAARARRLGRRLFRRLAPLAGTPGVQEVRGLGLIGAVELAGPEGAARARRVQALLMRRRILVRPLGPVLYLLPPLTITPAQLDRLAAALVAAVRAVLAEK